MGTQLKKTVHLPWKNSVSGVEWIKEYDAHIKKQLYFTPIKLAIIKNGK